MVNTAIINGVLLLQILVLFTIVWVVSEFVLNRRDSSVADYIPGIGQIETILRGYYREIALGIATIATVGSLFFSEVMGMDPCPLCWWQRIFMYPLVLLLGTATFLDRYDVRDYVIPLSLIGGGIGVYHYLLQQIDEMQAVGCAVDGGTPCDMILVEGHGYITIPLMALTAFTAIFLLMWWFGKESAQSAQA